MSKQLPEYLQLLKDKFPDFETDAVIIANIGMKINTHQGNTDHENICVNQCRVAWEMLNSIQSLVAYDYGLGAMSLCRNLFELVAGTIYLVENPSRSDDFIDYGKTVACELVEALHGEPKHLAALKKAANYDKLKSRFRKKSWHQKQIKDIVVAVGFQELYKSFYKEASSIAHGDSFVTLGYKNGAWNLARDITSWSKYCELALEFSFMLMANLYHRVVYQLKLPYATDVKAVLGRLMHKGLLTL